MADVGNRGGRPSERDEPALIELVMLDPAPAPSIGAPSATPRPRAPSPRRRWPLVALVAVLAVAVLAGVIVATLVGDVGDEGDDARQAAVPASTSTPTTSAATSIPATSIPATSIPATTIPATSTAPPTTAPVAFGTGPVAGIPGGWSLVSFDSLSLSVFDLDAGTTDGFSFDLVRFNGAESLIMLSDRFMYTLRGGAPSVWSQRYRNEPQRLIFDDASIITASSTPGQVWVARMQVGPNGEQLVAEIDADGRALTSLSVPNGLRVVGAGAAGLWLAGSGRIYALSRTGALQSIAVGTVVDASLTGVLYDDCAIAGPCTLRLAGIPPQAARIGPTAEIQIARPRSRSDPALSPNGRWLLLPFGVLDRRTGGQLGHEFVVESWQWSPDGEWLFLSTSSEGVIAWDLAQSRQIRVGANRTGSQIDVVAR